MIFYGQEIRLNITACFYCSITGHQTGHLFYYNAILFSSFCSGAYTPLTKEGNIVVDGVLASCYAYVNHDVAHIGMTPIRWFPNMIQWVFDQDEGLSAFADTANELGKWILPYKQDWQH